MFGRAWRDNDLDMGVLLCELDQVLLEVLTISQERKSPWCELYEKPQQIGVFRVLVERPGGYPVSAPASLGKVSRTT